MLTCVNPSAQSYIIKLYPHAVFFFLLICHPPYFQPPLPAEDYPSEDYPGAETAEAYEDLNNTGPPTLPKEYSLSHVSRTNIPRANLDRSTPPGWNLTVEPNGTWVFTSENSPDQVCRVNKVLITD